MKLWYVTGSSKQGEVCCFVTFGETADEAIARVMPRALNYHMNPYGNCTWTADEEPDGLIKMEKE